MKILKTPPCVPQMMHRRFIGLACIFGTGLIPAFVAAQDTEAEEEVIELSPFVVTTDEQMGYTATSTLAGTRIKTDLKDVGAAVSIYTEEFLKDIDGNSLEEVLTFTTSTEVAGADGNFSGAFAGEDNTSSRVEAAQSNRVRGLAQATLTRNFFTTDIPFDSYNSGQLTIVRGPNAILAGAGAPGGIVDGSLRNAAFRDSTALSLRIGKNGTHRQTLNFNNEIVDGRFAIRLSLLNENRKFRQEPANEKDQRAYLTANAILREGRGDGLFGRTTFRGNIERGKISGTPPNPLPPMMSTTGWFSETDAGKWYLDAHVRQRVAGENATGSMTPGQNFVPNQVDNFAEGFPLFAQMAIAFADPNSSTAGIGLTGDLASVQGFQGVANPGGGFFRGTADRNRNRAGYSRTRLLDRNVFDFYNKLLTGAFDFRQQDFTAYNVALEQLLLRGKAGFEFVYDHQDYRLRHDIPIRGNNTEVFIDVNRTLSVKDNNENPIVNPNFSRPFIVSRDAFGDQVNHRERETYRLTAFYGHDFRDSGRSLLTNMLGKHTLSGLYQNTSNDVQNEGFRSSWNRMAGDYDTSISVGNPGTFRSQVNAWFYIGGPTLGLDSASDIRLTPIQTARPEFGQSYDLQVYTGAARTHRTITATPERITGSYRENKEEFESLAIAHQAHLFDEHLVTLISYREDTSNRSIGEYGTDRDTTTNGDLTREDFILVEDPELQIGSWTKSVVGLFPEKYLFDLPLESDLRVFWNQSENFTPSGARRNIYNEDVGPPRGETEEYGFNLSTLNGKLDLRVTWFETKVINSSVAAGGNPYSYMQALMIRMVDAHNTGVDVNDPEWGWNTFGFNSFIDVANAFYDALPDRLILGPGTQFEPGIIDNGDGSYDFNADNIPQLSSISDTVSEGVEIEAIFNPTRNWRMSISVAQQKAVKSNVAGLEIEFAEEWLQNLEDTYGTDIYQASRNPAIGQDAGWLAQYNNETLFGIRSEAAKSGSSLPELAEWRVNVVSSYNFRKGLLKGLRIGGAIRWTDERAAGYPNITNEFGRTVSDIANPYYTDDDLRVNMNMSYNRKLNLGGQKVDWTISLYASNIIGDDDLIVTKYNPDRSIGQVRIPPERGWSITNSFRF